MEKEKLTNTRVTSTWWALQQQQVDKPPEGEDAKLYKS